MKKILVGLLVFIVIICAVGFILPTDFAIAKSVTIDAPPAEVHAWVGHLEKWEAWAPWKEDDPSMKTTLGEKTTGIGAYQSWSGESGDGELTFTKCDPESGIAYDMAFIMDDTKSPSTAAMSYEKAGEGTTVTWTMEGDIGTMMPRIMAGYMNVFMMERSVGDSFDKGLASLKSKVEGK